MTEIEILREENAALHAALEMISANLTNSDGVDPEAWWLALSSEQAALIRRVVEKNKQPPPVAREPELRCRHGVLWGHCPDCPTLAEIVAQELENAARETRRGSTDGSYA